jgi:hypothetical protein
MIWRFSFVERALSTHCIEGWISPCVTLDMVVRRIVPLLKGVNSWLFSQ